MRKVNLAEAIVSLVLIMVAGMFLVVSTSIPHSSLADPLGPTAFPQAVFWMIIILCMCLTVIPGIWQLVSTRSTRRKPREETARKRPAYRRFMESGDAPALLTAILLVLYLLVWRVLGFALTSLIFIWSLSLILSPKDQRSALKSLLVAVFVTAIIYVAFVHGFRVDLPQFALFG